MTLSGLIDQIGDYINGVASKGSYVRAMYMSEASEKYLLRQLATAKSWASVPDVDLVPEFRIHGVPVRVKSVPSGQIWYLIAGGKK